MNDFIEKYREFGISRHGIVIFTPDIALEIIDEAERCRVPIIGVDAFVLYLKSIQPVMEHSVDLSSAQDGAWDQARSLIQRYRNSEFLFELTFTIPNEEIHKRQRHFITVQVR
jgi:hypothetical protein